VLLLAVAVVVGLVSGRAARPLGAHAPRLRFTWVPLLGVGAAVNLLAYLLDGTAATLALAASLALLLGFVGVNTQVTGVVVIGAGLLLNLVSVVLNDGMPVRGSALVTADVVAADELDTVGFSGPRHLETSADTVPVLGDVLPLPVGGEVMSFGDLIVVFGAADAVRELARRHRRAWAATDRADYAATMAQARLVQDWGTAPRLAPDSGSQCSAKPDVSAPPIIDLASEPATAPSPALVAATHSR
jgi:hypothetical protein